MAPNAPDEDYLPEIYRRFGEAHQDVMDTYAALAEACRAAGPLSSREQRLAKLGVAVGLGSEGAVRSHVRRGISDGFRAEELLHAILLAVPTAGFPATIAAYQWAMEVLDHDELGSHAGE